MLFGSQKPRGLFGAPQPPQMPMGGAQYNLAPSTMQASPNDNIQAALAAMPPMSGQQAAPNANIQSAISAMPPMSGQGMFGAKNPGVNWGGVIADALAGAAGREPAFLNSVMAGRERDRLAQHAAEQRQASMEDRMAYHDYTVANPGPQKDDNFTRTLQAAGIDPASAQGVAMFKKRAEMLTNPMQLVPDGYGGVRPVHVNGEMGATGAATDDDWTNAKPMGGGVGNGPGGFPGF